MTEKIEISTKESFTVDELKKLIQCIRDIEQNNTTRHINVFMRIPQKTMKELDEINNSVKPELPYKSRLKMKVEEDDEKI